MQLHELKPPRGAVKRRKIVGRGPGSGSGKTSGTGHKGQRSRSGRGIMRGSEGGQMSLLRRLPKVGFRSKNPIIYQFVNLKDLNRFKEGAVINAEFLKSHGLVKSLNRPVKILGEGDVKKAFTVQADRFSKSAEEKIVKAGGKAEIIEKKAANAAADSDKS